MARTTSDLVKTTVETDDTISTDLAAYIAVANAIVTEKCEPAVDSNGDKIHDATRLEMIERYLAGHFYACRDNAARITSESAGPVSASYSSSIGKGLEQTIQGQQAMALDTSGALSDWNTELTNNKKKRKASVTWGGKKLEN